MALVIVVGACAIMMLVIDTWALAFTNVDRTCATARAKPLVQMILLLTFEEFALREFIDANLKIVYIGSSCAVEVEWGSQVSASGGVSLSYVAADAEPRPFLSFSKSEPLFMLFLILYCNRPLL